MNLSDPLPAFLHRLDSDRDAAIADFGRFVEQLFREAPPPNFQRVHPDEREDVISEVVVHCIENDCARLRRYRPQEGALFAGWLATVAYRKIADLLKRERHRDRGGPDGEGYDVPSAAPDPEQLAIHRELERIFLLALRELGRRCRLLLRLRGLEFTNREIVKLLRLPARRNKAIGNQIIACRKELTRKLRRRGFFEFGAAGPQGG